MIPPLFSTLLRNLEELGGGNLPRDFKVPLGHLFPGAARPRLHRAAGGFPNCGTRSLVPHPTLKPTALGAPARCAFPGRVAPGPAQPHMGVSAEVGQELQDPRGGTLHVPTLPWHVGACCVTRAFCPLRGPSACVGVGSPPLLIKKDSFLGPLWGWGCSPHVSPGEPDTGCLSAPHAISTSPA